jgi:carboxymethylenebutenolidase
VLSVVGQLGRARRSLAARLALFLAALLVVVACGEDGGEAAREARRPDDQATDHAAAMAREHAGETPRPAPGILEPPERPVQSREVQYGDLDGAPVTGFLALPEERAAPLPGLVVIHEWWGLNDNIRSMTQRLAGLGYVVLAVDLYHGEVAADPDRAHALMEAAREREDALANLEQAVAFLRDGYAVERLGSIGWCFGGGWSLNAALAMPDAVNAAVIYYGRLETDPARLASLEAPLLGLFGGEDRSIPEETVREFQRALDGLGKTAEIHVYPGAGHAFANPSGERWQAEAAEDAWRRTVEFLARHLQDGSAGGGAEPPHATPPAS